MNTHNTKDQAEITYYICGTVATIGLLISLIIFIWLHNQYYENVAKEAIKACLVQQQVSGGNIIWVKPEDYKPYPLSSFDAPHWNK